MSQIDKLTFIPHLFWFCILFIFFYFLMFSYILPSIFEAMKVRNLFFFSFISNSLLYNVFYFFIFSLYNYDVLFAFALSFLTYLVNFKHCFTVAAFLKSKAVYSRFYIV